MPMPSDKETAESLFPYNRNSAKIYERVVNGIPQPKSGIRRLVEWGGMPLRYADAIAQQAHDIARAAGRMPRNAWIAAKQATKFIRP